MTGNIPPRKDESRSNRKMGGWRAFWNTYPRAAFILSLVLALFLVADVVLVIKRIDYGSELTVLSASLTRAEQQRLDAIEAKEKNMVVVTMELLRRQAMTDTDLHLVVDSGKGLMYLQHGGAVLRVMSVRLGREATVGEKPDAVRLAPPRGKRLVVRIVDDSHDRELPVSNIDGSGQPSQNGKASPGEYGPIALILDGGSVIYTQPKTGPLSDPDYVMPGSIRAEIADMEAIREDLQAGMAVYFL